MPNSPRTRLQKIARGVGYAVIVIAVLAVIAFATRSNPLGPIAGRALSGELVAAPVEDWAFTDESSLIAVETRPAAPHSVTTICFVHDGVLYVPAQGGSAKSWTHYAVSNPSVRLLIDGRIYPVTATRIADASLRPELTEAVASKYDFVRESIGEGGELPDDLWLFRMDPAAPDVASDAAR
jgi:hypothetical protein